MSLLDKNINGISQLCKKYSVETLYAFGSVLTPRFNESSDIDLLVNFKKTEIPLHIYADNFFDFMYELEHLFNRKVDLVCEDAISNPYFRQELEETKKLIYG